MNKVNLSSCFDLLKWDIENQISSSQEDLFDLQTFLCCLIIKQLNIETAHLIMQGSKDIPQVKPV